MTTEQKTAGYFDAKRQSPMYLGDVYVLPFENPEFFKIVKPENEGFKVVQVGTTNSYALCDIGKRLVEEGKFIGNEGLNPHTIDEYIEIQKANEEAAEVVTHDDVINAEIEEEHAEAAKASENEVLFPNTPLSDTPEGVQAETSTVEAEQETSGTAEEGTATANSEAVEAVSETNEKEGEKEGENEQLCSTDSDGTNAGIQKNTDESSTKQNGTDTDRSAKTKPAADNKPTEEKSETGATGKNVIVETAAKPVPEVIANTADEKNALLRVKLLNKHIDENNAQIIQLQDKIEYHSQLASTLTYEPFVKLKNLVSEALHSNVDDENVKGIKERTKDFESIINIQNLLKDHQRQADKAEQDIADLEDEISKFEEEIAVLNEKIDMFARQTKLPLDSATAKTPEAKAEEATTEAAAKEEATV